MSVNQKILEDLLTSSFPESKILLKDLVGDEDHYELTISSPLFANKSKIEQHKMVNNVLKEYLGKTLHALTIKTIAINNQEKKS